MADFEIKTERMKSAAGQERAMARKLSSLSGRLKDCQGKLDPSVSPQYLAVKKNMDRLGGELSDLAIQTGRLADVLEQISRTYEETEKEICGYYLKYDKIPDSKNGTDTITPSDGLSALSKLIKALNDEKDNPYAKLIVSLLSMITAGMGLSGSENLAQWFQAFMGFSGNTIGFGSKFGKSLEELIGKHGMPAAKQWLQKNGSAFSKDMKWMGSIGNAVGFASQFYGAIQDSDSFAAFLKNSGGWISSGGGLVGDLNGLEKADVKATVHPIVSLLGMAGYATGDIIELATDGHPLTGQELSDLLLGTGLTGAKSCISQITFGLVDFDTQRSMGIFDKNIAATNNLINSFDFPTGGKAVLAFAASPFVAVYSFGETIFDFGYQIGDGIMGLFAT